MHENVQYFGKRLREYVMMNIGIMHYAVLCLKDDIFLYVTITIIQQWTLDNPSSSLSSQNCLKGHLRSEQFCVRESSAFSGQDTVDSRPSADTGPPPPAASSSQLIVW